MIVRFVSAKRQALLGAIGLMGVACSATSHECYETRDCPESNAPIDLDPGDQWWNSSGGQPASDSGSAGASGEDGELAASSPSVLSVSPSDGARGVKQDARIVITFSQPMAAPATEAAYESSDLPATALSFSWDESKTTLTLTPRAPLDYASQEEASDASDTPGVSGDAEFPARVYRFGFGAGAMAQSGRALEATHFTFSTLRQVSLTLDADRERTGNWTEGEGEGIHNCLREPSAEYEPSVCVGDDLNNVRYSGFLSFDLGAWPDGIAEFSSARLLARAVVHGTPAELGASRWEHVVYDELGEAALAAPATSPASALFAPGSLFDDAQLALNLDVTAAVRDDYESRAQRSNRSQYRLTFSKLLANDHWDDVELSTSSIRLEVRYLVP